MTLCADVMRAIEQRTGGKFKSCELDITYPLAWGDEGVDAKLASLCAEAVDAIKGGKKITSATICMEKDENLWKLTLKGETFGFASFKSPQVRIERDNTVEEMSEREAAFYERMYLLEQGVQLFDSLFTAFLKERLSDGWAGRLAKIQEWLEGGK